MIHNKLPYILLIEDNEDDYEATMRSFSKHNFSNPIKWCRTGKKGLEYLEKKLTSQETLPSLILLDLNMPGIDGKKVLRTIKTNQLISHIPIIILTTSNDDKDVSDCYQIGASTYIQKPVTFKGLTDSIGKVKEYWFGLAVLPKEHE